MNARAAFAATLLMVLAFAPAAADAQQEEQPNPFIPQRSQVSFYGTGSAQFTPRAKAGTMMTPSPECMPKSSQVGFKVECVSDSTMKTVSTCRGTMSFYALNVTRTVSGTVAGSPETSFSMSLNSPDGVIQGCTLGNGGPAEMGTANTITMPSCALTIGDCSGDAAGAGPNHSLTSSAAVTVTKAE